uniref:PPM-type phosphatase domain-containing protein n=1 Tax=Angiostrongylus cantonensis TaxID=6313 RepID=A0A0K0D8T2_ANGCA
DSIREITEPGVRRLARLAGAQLSEINDEAHVVMVFLENVIWNTSNHCEHASQQTVRVVNVVDAL